MKTVLCLIINLSNVELYACSLKRNKQNYNKPHCLAHWEVLSIQHYVISPINLFSVLKQKAKTLRDKLSDRQPKARGITQHRKGEKKT